MKSQIRKRQSTDKTPGLVRIGIGWGVRTRQKGKREGKWGKESGEAGTDLVGLAWQAREPKVQGKDGQGRNKRDNMGLRFTIDLLLPKCLSPSRAMVILCRHY